MALTLRHWIGAALLGCATLAVAFLPPAVEPSVEMQRARFRDRTARSLIAGALHENYRLALFLRRRNDMMDAIHRLAPRPASTPVVLADPQRPAARRTARMSFIRRTMDTLAPLLAPLDPTVRAAIVLTADTGLSVPGAGGWVGLREVTYFLPEGTDGRTCLVLVTWTSRLPTSGAGLLGPCAFYAAFGRPGPGVRTWLQAVAYYPTLEPDWLRTRPAGAVEGPEYLTIVDEVQQWGLQQALFGRAYGGLNYTAAGCAAGHLERCRELANRPPPYARPEHTRGIRATIAERFWWTDDGNWMLADLVREMGRERFTAFWRSPLPRDSAFTAAFGMTLETWMHRWLAARQPNVRVGPAIRTASVLLGLLFAGALVAGGAFYTTRRQIA